MIERRRLNRPGRPVADPSPQEIEEASAAIRDKWSALDRLHRLGWKEPGTTATPAGFAAEPARGLASTRIHRRPW